MDNHSLSILKTTIATQDPTVFNIITENNIENYFNDSDEVNLYQTMLGFYRKTHQAPTFKLIQSYYQRENYTDGIKALITRLKSKRVKTYDPQELEGFITLQNRLIVKERLVDSIEDNLDNLDTSSLSELDENIFDLKTEALSAEIAIADELNVERLIHSDVNALDIFKQKYEKRVSLGGKKIADFGYQEIDEVTGGLKSTDLISIVGYAKQFKSTLLRNFGKNFIKQGKNPLFITIEMSFSEIEDWFLTMHGNDRERFPDGSRFTYKELGDGKVEDEDYMYSVYDDLASADDLGVLYILKPSGMYSYDRFVGDLIRVENSFVDIDMILIDSINLMDDTQRDTINELIRQIRQLTLSKNDNMGIPVISPFQINRAGYVSACAAEGNLYDPSAIREYGEVEMSSTNVFTVIQTPEMREAKIMQIQHLISRESDLFKPIQLRVDAEVGLIQEIMGGNNSIDYVEDTTANEIVEIVTKELF